MFRDISWSIMGCLCCGTFGRSTSRHRRSASRRRR